MAMQNAKWGDVLKGLWQSLPHADRKELGNCEQLLLLGSVYDQNPPLLGVHAAAETSGAWQACSFTRWSVNNLRPLEVFPLSVLDCNAVLVIEGLCADSRGWLEGPRRGRRKGNVHRGHSVNLHRWFWSWRRIALQKGETLLVRASWAGREVINQHDFLASTHRFVWSQQKLILSK